MIRNAKHFWTFFWLLLSYLFAFCCTFVVLHFLNTIASGNRFTISPNESASIFLFNKAFAICQQSSKEIAIFPASHQCHRTNTESCIAFYRLSNFINLCFFSPTLHGKGDLHEKRWCFSSKLSKFFVKAVVVIFSIFLNFMHVRLNVLVSLWLSV